MFRQLATVALLVPVLAACGTGGTTVTSGTPSDGAAVSAVTREANEAFRKVPDGYADCGSTNHASGWPTTTVFSTDPGAACVLSAARSGEPSQHAFHERGAAGKVHGWIVRVDGPGDISTIEYSVDATGAVESTETTRAVLVAGSIGPPTCTPGSRASTHGVDSIGAMTRRCTPGNISGLAGLIDRLDPRTILVFAGGASYDSSGASTAIDRASAGRRVRFVRRIPADPTLDDVDRSIAVFRADPPDLVVAVGGGSVIDLAKAVRSIGPASVDARPFLLGDRSVEAGGPPLLAMPTTAGTGSEATRYAVFTVDGEKRPIGHPALIPEHVILDPELTYSLPPAVTASTGLDALAQAMESMWSTRSTDGSSADAREALRLAWNNLPAAVHDPDPASRTAMCTAAYLSGRAIDVSATTAPHALSFHLTTAYGVPHGHAVALMLGPVLEFNAGVTGDDCSDARGPGHVRSAVADVLGIVGADTPSKGRERLAELVGSLGLEPTLAGVGVVTSGARRSLARSASPVRLATNPRRFTGDGLSGLIAGIP